MTDNTNNQTSGSNPSSASQNVKVYYEPTRKDAGYTQSSQVNQQTGRDVNYEYEEEKKEQEARKRDAFLKKNAERVRLNRTIRDESVNEKFERMAKRKADKEAEDEEADEPDYMKAARRKQKEFDEMFEKAKEKVEDIKKNPVTNTRKFLGGLKDKGIRVGKKLDEDLKRNKRKQEKLKRDKAEEDKKKAKKKDKDNKESPSGKSKALDFIDKDMKKIQGGLKASHGGGRIGGPKYNVKSLEGNILPLGGYRAILPDARPRTLPNQKTNTLKQLPIDFVNVDVFRHMKTGRMDPLEKLSAEVRGKNPIDRMIGKPKQLKGKKVKVPTISYKGIEKKINKKGGLF